MPHKITDLPHSRRPREKMLASGAQNLSDTELLAILIGSGTRRHNALSLARQLLPHLHDLTSFKLSGLGQAKLARVHAALELGRRLFAPTPLKTISLTSTPAILAQVADIADKKQEYLVVLYLNARHELIHKETIAIGNLNTSLIEPKEIFTPALAHPSAALILAHNHPSGNPQPSAADIKFTRRIHSAANLLGFTLVDHLIIASHSHFSFRNYKPTK